MARLPICQIAATGLFWAWCFLWAGNAGNADWPVCGHDAFAIVRLPLWSGNCLALAFFVYILSRRRGMDNRVALAVCGVFQTAGTLAVLLLCTLPEPPAPAIILASLVTGFAMAGYLPGWRKSVASVPAIQMPMFVGSSGALGVAVFMIALLLPTAQAQVLFVVLPLVSGALALADRDADAHVFDPVRVDAQLSDTVRGTRQIKWVYIIVTVAILLIMGLDTLGYRSGAINRMGIAVGIALSVVFLAVFLLGYNNVDIARYLVAPYMPLAIAVSIIVPFLWEDASTFLQALITLDCACWCFMLAEGLGVTLQSSRSHVVQNIALSVCPIAAYALESLLGLEDGGNAALFATACAVVVATTLLIMFHTSFFVQRRAQREVDAQAAARALAKSHGLSARESEVLSYLAVGHGQPYVAEKLGLAPGTVKTYVLHIYQKLDVHGREELLDKVNEMRESIFVC